MGEAAALVALAAGVLLWAESLRAREQALAAGRRACERRGLQLLDDAVAFAALRLVRDEDGRVRVERVYTFEFSDDGDGRRRGAIVLVGERVAELRLDPPGATKAAV
ncbi:MAG: DUF3301 domain-containing protein [Burkholderiales bacterium]|nr:DUF3301 domain-containing protein [Burkholderiales bacterium]